MNEPRFPSVVHLLWSGGAGGIERLVHDLASEQLRQGMRVGVAFARPSDPFASAVRAAGVPVIDLAIRSGYEVQPTRLMRATLALRHWDVVHLHGFNLPLAAAAIGSGRPIVFTEHGNFALGRRLGVTGRIKRVLQGVFLRHRVEAITANSHHTAGRMASLYRIPLAGIDVVWNGVDFAEITAPAETRPTQNGLVAAYVGRLVAWKRIELLIEACAGVAPEHELTVLIVGAGPREDRLRRLAHDYGLDDRVHFLGYRSDLDDILASVDVLVHPSQAEPFGLAVVEACARGLLPVVFADAGGALEVIPPDARIVHDIDELSATLTDLSSSDTLSAAARQARSTWAREKFPISRPADAYLEHYLTVLEGVGRVDDGDKD